jgi:hypothetical protein
VLEGNHNKDMLVVVVDGAVLVAEAALYLIKTI